MPTTPTTNVTQSTFSLTCQRNVNATDPTSLSYFVAVDNGPLKGEIRVPGDKSISHRAVMLGSIADGVSRVSGFLTGEDSVNTAKAFAAMGVGIEGLGGGELVISGVGLDGLKGPSRELDLGNSGTSMRLLAGLLSAQRFNATLTGDQYLRKRPMDRVIKPLSLMGARITGQGERSCPPLKIDPATGGLSVCQWTAR